MRLLTSVLVSGVFCASVSYAGPVAGSPRRSLGELLPSGSLTVDVLAPKAPNPFVELSARFEQAMRANNEWLLDYTRDVPAGEPLPWHPKLGLSQAEYDHFRLLLDASTLAKVSHASLTFDRRHDGSIVLKGKGATALLDGIEVDVAKGTVRTPFGRCGDVTPFEVDRAHFLTGPWYGYSCDQEGDPTHSESVSFRFSVGERALSRSGLLTYRYRRVSEGRSVETFELYLRYVLPATGIGQSKGGPTLTNLGAAALGCDDGRVEDCVKAADIYRKHGSAGDNDRAALLYERACVWGSSMGCSGLGEMLGEGLLPDKKRALERLGKCCDFENPHACGILGVQYEFGGAVARDLARAMQLYRKGCEAANGNPEACRRLGMGYDKGRGVAQDAVKARELFEKACKGGHAEACGQLTSPRRSEPAPSQWLEEIQREALDEAVRATLAAARRGDWPLKIKSVRAKTVVTYKTDEPVETIRQIRLGPIHNGLVYEHSKDMDSDMLSESVNVALYGWLSASGRSVHDEHRDSHRLARISFDVPLKSLEAGSTFSYRTTTVAVSDGRSSSTDRLTTCIVGRPSKAALLHTKLPGDAIPLECSTSIADKHSNRTSGFLLPGVGWYFAQSTETASGFRSRSELLDVELF